MAQSKTIKLKGKGDWLIFTPNDDICSLSKKFVKGKRELNFTIKVNHHFTQQQINLSDSNFADVTDINGSLISFNKKDKGRRPQRISKFGDHNIEWYNSYKTQISAHKKKQKLYINMPGEERMRINLGKMIKPLAKLKKCQTDQALATGHKVGETLNYFSGAVPKNNPGRWIRSNDYPVRALREEIGGTVGFNLLIGPTGDAKKCTVIRSSGSDLLDAATCPALMGRAQFFPAIDNEGRRTVSRWQSQVRWQIPN